MLYRVNGAPVILLYGGIHRGGINPDRVTFRGISPDNTAHRRMLQVVSLLFKRNGVRVQTEVDHHLVLVFVGRHFHPGLKEHAVKVLIIDPIYLALLAGLAGKGIDAANLFEMGPLLLDVAREAPAVPSVRALRAQAIGRADEGFDEDDAVGHR